MDDLSSAFTDVTKTIPGYGIIAQILLQSFGVDAGKLVSKYITFFAFYKVAIWLRDRVYDFLQDHFTSVIEVDDDDALWAQLMNWAVTQQMTKKSRGIKAETGRTKELHHHPDELFDPDPEDDDDMLGDNGMFSYHKFDDKIPIKYKPNNKRDFFKFNGRWFQWSTDRRQCASGRGMDRLIYIRCLGRSTKPIKEFLTHIKSWARIREDKKTEVFRSCAMTGQTGFRWRCESIKPSRPIDTISLDDQQKTHIIQDINEYMKPSTERWYAMRGIPYRRGYLFHGPPGTGKTSLSFALAGIFGLQVYCVSLSEATLTESELGILFRKLPERCIVLLEDIDSAGLRREEDSMTSVVMSSGEAGCDSNCNSSSGKTDTTQRKGWFGSLYGAPATATVEKVATTAPTGGRSRNTGRSLISLAGLLNTIDGAASHEGRVLIMTTNYPEHLDSALIRPGRVDLQIEFTLATRDQIRDIFKRMYNTDLDRGKATTNKSLVTPATSPRSSYLSNNSNDTLLKPLSIERTKLTELAAQFSASLPEKIFSPAEVQGFLLMKKGDPEAAVKEVGKVEGCADRGEDEGKEGC